MAILTGGQVISEDVGLKLENTTLDLLGTARRVIVTKDETTIMKDLVTKLMSQVASSRSRMKSITLTRLRPRLQERLAKLSGGVRFSKSERQQRSNLKKRSTASKMQAPPKRRSNLAS